MTEASLFLLVFAVGAFGLQVATLILAQIKQQSVSTSTIKGTPQVSVLRPLCGLENNLEETLGSTFAASYPNFEIIFCVADPNDPVIALAERLIAAHPHVRARLLIGDSAVSGNPKLNNLITGWSAAKSDWILMADSNVLLPADYIQRLLAEWRDGTGLVSSPPAGIRPDGFAARLECAFLNSFQGRWQLASAQIGQAFAQGKMLFWHRDLLDRAGGLAVLGREMAEDVASSKLVRGHGLKVRLTSRLFEQPIGRRRFAAVWKRQVRWAKVRRLGFLPLFLPEIFVGGAFPLLAVAILAASGVASGTDLLALALIWYGGEFLLAKASGWPASPADVLAWMCRDAILPALWGAAWFGNSFEWRGNAMRAEDVAHETDARGLPIAQP
ncbi:MAG: ceramide glucosyltransferase [Deltaproteobacteria bacterium]